MKVLRGPNALSTFTFICAHCKAMLEAEKADIVIKGNPGRPVRATARCPCCGIVSCFDPEQLPEDW